MNAKVTFILSLSCGLPLLIYLFTYQRVDKKFHPLIAVFFLALVTEISIRLNILYWHIPFGNYTIYTLGTVGYLYLWLQFYRNMDIIKNKRVSDGLLLFYILFIVINAVLLLQKENMFNFFRNGIVFCIIMLYYSVQLFIRQVFGNSRNILMNPLFLIAVSGVIFYSFYIFIVSLILLQTNKGVFINLVFDIQKWVNVFCYTLYAIAILWIPKTRNYITSF